MTYLLAHDVGTSGVKTVLVRADGTSVGSRTSEHTTSLPRPGWAEQNAADWWRGVCENTRALAAAHPEACSRIAAVGLSGQMLGCLPVDASGRPLRPSPIHSDCRAAEECMQVAEAAGSAEAVYELTGNILDPRSPLCKLLWLKNHEPEVYDRTARVLQSKDYIVGCLTGSFDSTDYSDASHAQFLDVTRRVYVADLLSELGLSASLLPDLHRGTDVVGKLTAEAAGTLGLSSGIPVVAGGGDGACATAGAGVAAPGDTYCCIGTTAWIATAVSSPVIDRRCRIFDVCGLDGETWGVFGTVQAAGRALAWIMEVLGETDFSRVDDLVAEVPPGSDGLIFLPYLEGERSPIFDADARGVFFGLTPAHSRGHLLRATYEGVAFALRSVLDALREFAAVPSLRLIGGGGQSATWAELLADMGGIPVERLSTPSADATCLGAAMAAGVGVGVYPDLPSAAKLVGTVDTFEPRPGRTNAYDPTFALYESLYSLLKPAYGRLRDLREKSRVGG